MRQNEHTPTTPPVDPTGPQETVIDALIRLLRAEGFEPWGYRVEGVLDLWVHNRRNQPVTVFDGGAPGLDTPLSKHPGGLLVLHHGYGADPTQGEDDPCMELPTGLWGEDDSVGMTTAQEVVGLVAAIVRDTRPIGNDDFEAARAAHALAVATRRGYAHDRDGLLALGREIVGRVRSLTEDDPDELAYDVLGDFEANVWLLPEEECTDPQEAIGRVEVDPKEVAEDVVLLERPSGFGSPQEGADNYQHLYELLQGVYWALWLVVDEHPKRIVGELSRRPVRLRPVIERSTGTRQEWQADEQPF